MTRKKVPKIGDTVEIITINEDWLEIDSDAENLIGEQGTVKEKSKFEGFGMRYQVVFRDTTVDERRVQRRLWLPKEWLLVLN